jgi:hypothetical protein
LHPSVTDDALQLCDRAAGDLYALYSENSVHGWQLPDLRILKLCDIV